MDFGAKNIVERKEGIMAKLCKYCNRFPVFGGGYCKYHQYMRTDKKPKGLSPRRPSGEANLFKEIWNQW